MRSHAWMMAAVALLGAASTAAIALATRSRPPGPGGAGDPAPAEPAPTPAGGAPAPSVARPDPAASALVAPRAARTLAVTAPLPEDPTLRMAIPDVERVLPSRARHLVVAAIEREVEELRACFPTPTEGVPTGRPSARPAAFRPRSGPRASAVLALVLQPLEEQIQIVDVAVEEAGPVPPRELACAAEALRGRTLRVEGSRPARRVEMPYRLP